jgi:hypothetical protein
MSCNHLSPDAETNTYHEGNLICTSCGLLLRQGQLISETTPLWNESHHAPLASTGYDRSLFFLKYLRKHHGADLTQEEMYLAVRIYREFAAFFVHRIQPFIVRKYMLPSSFLACCILTDALGIKVAHTIRTPRIVTDFSLWWDFFKHERGDVFLG